MTALLINHGNKIICVTFSYTWVIHILHIFHQLIFPTFFIVFSSWAVPKETILCMESRTIPDVKLSGLENIPINQSKVVKPEKCVLVAKYQTRLKMK